MAVGMDNRIMVPYKGLELNGLSEFLQIILALLYKVLELVPNRHPFFPLSGVIEQGLDFFIFLVHVLFVEHHAVIMEINACLFD